MRVTWHDKPPRRAPPPEKPPPKAEPADAVIAYHEATKHTYWSVREGNFQLDWANQPLVYKRFEGVPWVQLPSAFPKVMPPTLTALEALADRTAEPPPVDLAAVGQLCYYAYGLTAKKQYPGVTYYLRSAPSAGALFPVEATLVIQDIEGLPDGVYHYSVADFALFRMREGRFGPLLAAATAGAVRSDAPVTLVLSTIFWRSSWKYRDRAYRYCLQDAGHAAGNFLTVGRGLGYRVRLCTIFADQAVNALIDVDDAWEGAMALVSLDPPSGGPEPPVPEALEPPERLDLEFATLSREAVDYPRIREVHRATSLPDVEAVRKLQAARGAWRTDPPIEKLPTPLPGLEALDIEGQDLATTCFTRRSSRDFFRAAIPVEKFGPILRAATRGAALECADEADTLPGRELVSVWLLANGVTGLRSGAYWYDPAAHAVRLAKPGHFRSEAEYLSLEQELCGNAGVTFFFLTRLKVLQKVLGPRAYRSAHIEAGIIGQGLYLAAQALDLGASGIGAYYDDDVIGFLELDEEGTAVIYDFVIGRPTDDKHLVPGDHL